MSFQKERYPENWKEISWRIRCRARWMCEGSPAYPGCRARNGQPHPRTGSKVVLTVAHLGIGKPDGSSGDPHDKMDCRDENLKAWCHRCHLNYDRDEHALNAAKTRRRRKVEAGQLELIATN